MPRDELIDFNSEDFLSYSVLVADLAKMMLEINPKKRATAREVMENKWVNQYFQNYKKKLLHDLKSFNQTEGQNNNQAAFLAFKSRKLKKALFSYFANILATVEDKEMYSQIFRQMDSDEDGVVTTDEFEAAMQQFNATGNRSTAKSLTKGLVKQGKAMELHEFINCSIVFNLLQ